jgi:hypothetical protein
MAGMYFGVAGVARKCNKAYWGVDGLARKVKKAYFGVGGLARLMYSFGPEYGGQLANAADADARGMASIGNYALIAGGYNTVAINTVDVYNSVSLVKSSTTLSSVHYSLAGANTSTHAWFVGGDGGQVFDVNLTRTVVGSGLAYSGMKYMTGTKLGTKAIFYGGTDGAGNTRQTVYVVNPSSTTISYLGYIATYGGQTISCSLPQYALFYSYGPNSSKVVDCFNTSNVKSTLNLGTSTRYSGAEMASNSRYAIVFCGRNSSNTEINTVEAFDTNLVRTTAQSPSVPRTGSLSASTDDYAMFICGRVDSTGQSKPNVTGYDTNLVKTEFSNFPISCDGGGYKYTAVAGSVLFVAGGNSTYRKNIYYYSI